MILDPEKLADYVWLNGEFVKWEEARTHLLAHSLHYAGAVFEGMRAYNGKIFKLEAHNQRLMASAKVMQLSHPYSKEELNIATQNTLEKNNLQDAYIRPLIFRGPKAMGIAAFAPQDNVLIMAVPSKHDFRPAMKINLAAWRKPDPRSMPPQAKSSAHYAMSIVIRKEAREVSEYPDSLVLDFEDYIAECTTSNIFFSHQNEIVTPIADRFLDGITRQVVIEIAHKSGMKVTEKRLTLDDIESFESCFVTGTACEIQEVSLIDLGSKKVSFPGSSIITDLQKEFAIVAGK